MAAGGSAGTLYVTVAAKTDKLQAGMTKARKSMSALSGAAKTLGISLAGAFTTRAIVRGLMDTSESIDKIAKSADRLGASTEAFVGLSHGAQLSGVSADQLNTALNKFNRTIGDAKLGLETATRPLDTLGIKLRDIAELPVEEQLGLIADRFNQIKSPADRTRVAMELFGRGGAGMISVLKEGSAGLKEFAKDAESLGIVFSREEAAKVEEFNDNLSRLKDLMGGAWQSFVIDIAPAASKAVEDLLLIMKEVKQGRGGKRADGNGWFGTNMVLGMPDRGAGQWSVNPASWFWEAMSGAEARNAPGKSGGNPLWAANAERIAAGKATEQIGAGTFNLLGKAGKQALAASTMAENTAKNIAKLGKDGAAALGLGAKWNELQRAALLAPFKMTPKAKIGADEPGMVAKQHQAALTLARSGSVESYRQRAAIARQANPLLDIGKKQLKAGERTAVAVEQIAKNGVVLAPANLKGG